MNPKGIIISRTDSIGDVVLTLPMCGILKQQFPGCRIYFLSKSYTQSIIEACIHVDEYINWDAMKDSSPAVQIEILETTNADVIIHVFPRKEILWLAKRAGIPMRIATGGRLHTVAKCNKLVFFSRKKSNLHEAQLNLKLLKPLGIEAEYSMAQLQEFYGFSNIDTKALVRATEEIKSVPSSRKKIVLHPLSKGSASEWSLENYQRLIELLPKESYEIFITGTEEEGQRIRSSFPLHGENVNDVTGKFSLAELIAFISLCDVLIAASTGPLHIAAALGKKAIGVYSPKRPIHPGRWAPIGKDAHVLVADVHPKKGDKLGIPAEDVAQVVMAG